MSPTYDEQLQLLTDTAVALSRRKTGHSPGKVKVREYPEWVAMDGEVFPAEWVVEIRIGRPFRVHTLEVEAWRSLRSTPSAWADLVLEEVDR